MKRLTILAVILAGLTVVCMGAYKSRGSPLKIVKLAEPKLTGPVSLEQALARRRSVRRFTSQELNLVQIGQLAWAGQGITEKQKGFRTAPSAGAIYPISLYFITQDGMFVYHPDEHSLEQILRGDVRSALAAAALGQEPVAKAACDIIVAGEASKLAGKYGDRARRYMLMESGHVAQNILLQAVTLELGSVPIGAFDINRVRKVCKLPVALEPVYIICVGYPARRAPAKEEKQTRRMERIKAKKAVLIIASRNFRDEELFETKRALDAAAVQTVVASTTKAAIRGMLGSRAEATILVSDIVVDDYDAIIFIGGSGAKEYFDNRLALNIARETVKKGKVLAAICIAPTVLANAGLLDGVRVTSFSSERTRLQKAGAQYTGAPVERDGLIITASGPRAASSFGKIIVEAITSR